MFTTHVPGWLYEALPKLYLAGGLGAAFWSHTPMGVGSGLALAAVGGYIHWLRRRYRRQEAAQRALMDARMRRAMRSRAG